MPLTPKDILFITLSVSIAAITFFICLGFYYLLAAIRDFRNMVGSIKKKFDAIGNFIEHMKNKVESTAEATTVISKAIMEVVGYVKEKKSKIKNQKSK